MSSASRKISASGLRRWTKQEEMKKSTNPFSLNLPNPMGIQFARFVADHGDFQPVPDLELSDQLDHFGVRFRLREHESPELSPCERSLLVENRPAQVFLQRELALLVGVEGQVMPILHLRPVQFEVRRRPFAGMMIPPIGKQDTANIQKQRRDPGFISSPLKPCATFDSSFIEPEVWR